MQCLSVWLSCVCTRIWERGDELCLLKKKRGRGGNHLSDRSVCARTFGKLNVRCLLRKQWTVLSSWMIYACMHSWDTMISPACKKITSLIFWLICACTLVWETVNNVACCSKKWRSLINLTGPCEHAEYELSPSITTGYTKLKWVYLLQSQVYSAVTSILPACSNYWHRWRWTQLYCCCCCCCCCLPSMWSKSFLLDGLDT